MSVPSTVLQYLREVAGCPLSVEDGEGRTPLMLAAAGGHVAALKYLMEQDRRVFSILIACSKPLSARLGLDIPRYSIYIQRVCPMQNAACCIKRTKGD